MESSGYYGYSRLCWNSKVCSVNWGKQRKTSNKSWFSFIYLQTMPPISERDVHTRCIVPLHFLPFCRASLPRCHISPLCSILLLVQQRQVANFLPFNLQQFPCSRRTRAREEEPRLPWVNWARGLTKKHWREVKVF